VASYQFGSVFSGGGSDPPGNDSPQTWRSFVESYEAQASGFGIPLIYGIDAVHGNNNVSDTVVFPHNIGLGATRNPALLTQIGRITAIEMRGTSIDWTFAPAISPARDERWGRIFESYSEDPALTAELAVALVEGLQGDSLAAPDTVLATAKHFAGDGATEGGVDQADTVLDEATFRKVAVEVYQPLINAGVASVMVSYSSYNGVKMTGHAHWLTNVLRGEMGFRGIVGSDWAAAGQLPGNAATQVATAINAGIDMLMEPYLAPQDVDLIEAAPAASGNANIPMSRIDDAVTRILTKKCEHGMLATGYDPSGDSALLSQIGSQAHRDVARQAVRESAVLLRNEGSALPIPETARVHVAGSGADSLERQCGGWTVDWQGLGTATGGTPGVTTGTTILRGIQDIAGAGNVSYSQNGSGVPSGTTHIVVVLSEAPYAEGRGDQTNLDLGARTSDLPVLQTVSSMGLPVVAVLVTGRPLIIEPYLDLAHAWVAAWLPGSEANALADVLFGRHPPTGKLGHSWPRTMAQIPINVGDPDYETDPPLYPFGHGLSY
jgi:beta-glucosidase